MPTCCCKSRPGTDGALALALIHCLIEESWYDVDFVRRWTNGMFLMNTRNRRASSPKPISARDGDANRFVVWDEAKNQPVIYDAATGNYARDGVRPALFGTRTAQEQRRQ